MTDDTRANDPDDEDEENSIPLGSIFETLSELLDGLEEMDLDAGERRSGSAERDDVRFDYNVNIGSINPAGESRRNRARRNWDIRGESDDHEYVVRVDETEGELVVTADLPSVDDDELEVETNEETGALEIRVDGEVVESVPLDWDGATVTDVSFRNQILEVRVTPPDDDGDDGDDEDGEENGEKQI